MSTQPLSHKVAAIRAFAVSLPQTPPKAPPRIHNTPARAARGRGVPPSKKADAPKYSDLVGVDGLRISAHSGGFEVIDSEGWAYVEADTMADIARWFASYAHEVDRLAVEGGA